MKLSDMEKAATPGPPNSLPSWTECARRVDNSDFIDNRVATGGHGDEGDSELATQLHRFIYEYDDADDYRSAWFMHRLELVLQEAARNALPDLLDLLEQATCPNAPKSRTGEGCIGGKIQRYFHRDGAYFGDKPCPWCAKRKEILESE